MEGSCIRHFIHGFVHGGNHCWGKGLGHIPDAQADHVLVGVGLGIGCNFFGNGAEEIASRKLLVIFINFKHGITPFFV
jgi:hypothetical protein